MKKKKLTLILCCMLSVLMLFSGGALADGKDGGADVQTVQDQQTEEQQQETESDDQNEQDSNENKQDVNENGQNQESAEAAEPQSVPSVVYRVHVQNIGTMNEVSDGALAGTTGRGLRMEALQIHLLNAPNSSLSYSAHVQNIGWQDVVSDGKMAGTTGEALRVEAVKIKLNGELADQYDIVYRVHIQNYGWLNWARNGEIAGSAGKSLRMEAIQIKLVKKGETPSNAPVDISSASDQAFIFDAVRYQTHVQNIGDQDWKKDGEIAGTTGRSLRVEALAIKTADPEYLGADGSICYQAHVQDIGWQDWRRNGTYAGTTGRGLRMEALRIKLEGDLAEKYDIYYSTHVQNYGWMAWAKNGEESGTKGLSLRVEAVRIKLVKKGDPAPDSTGCGLYPCLTSSLLKNNLGVSYQTCIQDAGWTDLSRNGQISGTTGKGLRVEAWKAFLEGSMADRSYLTYHSHIQNIGNAQSWQDSRNSSAVSGMEGKGLRVEAVQINLNGYAAGAMDVWYRVHVQNYGWLGWAKNGEWAGTSNGSLRIEAIQIVLRTKSEGAPGSTNRHYIAVSDNSFVSKYNFAGKTSQIIDARQTGKTTGVLTVHNKDYGHWSQVMSTSCILGKNGVSWNKVEGDKKTPCGVYSLGQAFGILDNPGCTRSYHKVTPYDYWDGDSSSKNYNRLVDSRYTCVNARRSEHLIDYPGPYNYAVAINYNAEQTPRKGSAIFLHCQRVGGSYTLGCVAVPQNQMVWILRNLRNDALIYIH